MSRLILLVLAVLFGLLAFVPGCKSGQGDGNEWLRAAEVARRSGFRGEVVVIFGTGHIAGAAYNLSGSNGYLKLELDPLAEPHPELTVQPGDFSNPPPGEPNHAPPANP